MADRLIGRTALVTGAARGQGRAHAIRFASEGADVIALDVCVDEPGGGFALSSWDDLLQTVAEVEALGQRGHAAQADVRDRDALQGVVDATAEEFPRLDVIVANAAIARYAKFLDLDIQAWNATIAVNLTGVFNTVQLFAPRMIAAGHGGSIILTGSIAGVKGLPFCGAYAAAKHGVHGLMKVLALELGDHSIRVNTVDPGPVDTAMATDPTGPLAMSGADSPDGRLFLASFAPVLPLPESGVMSAETISDAVAWLASDESRFVTGISVPVDAGIVVR
jgi:SDR family mycofactocin-dependent oxidoreductase